MLHHTEKTGTPQSRPSFMSYIANHVEYSYTWQSMVEEFRHVFIECGGECFSFIECGIYLL